MILLLTLIFVATQVSGNCANDEWECANGECIAADYFCDGHVDHNTASFGADCSDGSDEIYETCCAANAEAYENECGAEWVTFTDAGWCNSDLDEVMWDDTVTVLGDKTATECWDACKSAYPTLTDLVADFKNDGYDTYCYCQDSCPCMREANLGIHLLAPPDFSVPGECEWVTFGDAGWCNSDLNVDMWNDAVANIGDKTATECWDACKSAYPTLTDLVADFKNDGSDTYCYCQDSCSCMMEANLGIHLLAPPDFSVPSECPCDAEGWGFGWVPSDDYHPDTLSCTSNLCLPACANGNLGSGISNCGDMTSLVASCGQDEINTIYTYALCVSTHLPTGVPEDCTIFEDATNLNEPYDPNDAIDSVCEFVQGDGISPSETDHTEDTGENLTGQDCARYCLQHGGYNGATIQANGEPGCWCENGMTGSDGGPNYMTCFLTQSSDSGSNEGSDACPSECASAISSASTDTLCGEDGEAPAQCDPLEYVSCLTEVLTKCMDMGGDGESNCPSECASAISSGSMDTLCANVQNAELPAPCGEMDILVCMHEVEGKCAPDGTDAGANNNNSSSSSIAVLIAIAAALFAF